ncbi:alpha/beta fold hydrolase [Rugamonas sp. CCM 8940]|uniref:alpha/beta fold hydrolase n=1 Tax=Rugamonas sp. CCM 8940 TaxID=2765359 RepID=UPI0018F55C0F|nr:alpha/beta hydrolase [Rugamonas sp. CCM 8940]MBJ7313392.1 alpha/beta hydrolase [Rugamonas sp. CCM 8940]
MGKPLAAPMPMPVRMPAPRAGRRAAAASLLALAAANASHAGAAAQVELVAGLAEPRRVEYELVRHDGSVPVVFENGLMAKLGQWEPVFRSICQERSAFAYNRPGYGKSAAVASPRDGEHIAEELRALLRSKGLNPPYILVGHSIGGLYLQLYARRHPDEVKALVLVDSTHPQQFLGAGAYEQWPTLVRTSFKLLSSSVEMAEFKASMATGAQVLALPAPAGVRVMVLSAARPLGEKSAYADDANAKRKDIVRLYPGAQLQWVDSGAEIPLEKPEAVLAAIRAVAAGR